MIDKMRALELRIEQAEANLQAARSTLNALKREEREKNYPPEPQSDFIAFGVKFSPSGTTYKYAAIRVGRTWYTTGGERFDGWGGLVDWVRKNHVDRATTVHELTMSAPNASTIWI